MPLKLIRRGKSKIWYVRGTVAGESVYETTGTADKSAAEGYRQKRESNLYERRVHGERAVVTFEEAALSYVEANVPARREADAILKLSTHFRNVRLADIDQAAVDRACAVLCKDGAAPATKIRSVITPLTSILNHAARRRWCDVPKFDRPEVAVVEPQWLTPEDALRLEAAAEPHLKPLLRFLLCTGARLSEALELEWKDVSLQDARATFRVTKGGRARHAGLPPAAVAALAGIDGREGPVFRHPVPQPRKPDEELRYVMTPYADRGRLEGGQLKRCFHTACRRAGLGKWEIRPTDNDAKRKVFVPSLTPHVLRHSWATWFYALTKDPFKLRNEGGWATVSMVERYAHLMKAELAPTVASVWGPSHPAIGRIIGANSVHDIRSAS